jgi:hypothetical protein
MHYTITMPEYNCWRFLIALRSIRNDISIYGKREEKAVHIGEPPSLPLNPKNNNVIPSVSEESFSDGKLYLIKNRD